MSIPICTYRIQLTADFGFKHLEAILPYLKELGVSHVYLSPYLRSRPGSTHGYDISDHNELNPELGSSDDFYSFAQKLNELQLFQLFDLVPNHMGILGNKNKWWNDVLENGESSQYSNYFDIDWSFSLKPELKGRVMLPVLGCTYAEALESGELQLTYQDGQFTIQYFEHIFPVAPCTIDSILESCLEFCNGGVDEELQELKSVVTAVRNLPRREQSDLEKVSERIREKEIIRKRLALVIEKSPELFLALDKAVEEYNGVKGRPESFDRLDRLLTQQAYRLSYFRVAADEINYRRFFDINELAALRMEVPEVFEQTHNLVLDLVKMGIVDGVRIDHVDGLYDPKNYLLKLKEALKLNIKDGSAPYIVVEKILADKELLPNDWGVCGTTGYDFLAIINGLYIEQANERTFNRIYSQWSNGTPTFKELSFLSKHIIQDLSLSAELHVLAQRLDRLSERSRHSRDFTFNALMNALRDIIAWFPVYRSYADENGISENDIKYVEFAVESAKRRNPGVHSSIFTFLKDTLLLKPPKNSPPDYHSDQLQFVQKFQQLTSPVMAKGIEDTSFYIFNRFISLNEVGGSPEVFGVSKAKFYEEMAARQKNWPYSLSASTTHDTKRGEDTRARLNVISELPDEFEQAIGKFRELNESYQSEVDGKTVPDKNVLYFLYQSLIGTWKLNPNASELSTYSSRLQEFMQKAVSEAKENTSWVNPNFQYNESIKSYVCGILAPESKKFHDEVESFVSLIQEAGYLNGLSQLVIKLLAPGIPDLYQGTELWDFSLVDPDNRRPVDFGLRTEYLAKIKVEFLRQKDLLFSNLVQSKCDGQIKLFTIWRALDLRNRVPNLFAEGEFEVVELLGSKAENLISFSRRFKDKGCLVIVPRLGSKIEFSSEDTKMVFPDCFKGLPLRNIFTEELVDCDDSIAIEKVFSKFPVAVFETC